MHKADKESTYNYAPPASVLLLRHWEWNYEANDWFPQSQDYVTLTVSHAISDQFGLAPVLRDLAALYTLEAAAANPALTQGPLEDLPPIVDGPAALQRSMRENLQRCGTGGDTLALGSDGLVSEHVGRAFGHDHFVDFGADLMTMFRQAATSFGVPIDILWLAVLAVSLGRTERWTTIPFALIVANRDDEGHTEMLGNMASHRALDVGLPPRGTYATVVAQVAEAVRNRWWRVPTLVEMEDKIWLNLRSNEYIQYPNGWQAVSTGLSSGGSVRRDAKTGIVGFLDELGDGGWMMWLHLEFPRFDTQWAEGFAGQLRADMLDMLQDPHRQLWPELQE